MAGKHINDPLDYLYEELSPKEMAAMRRHLADCPECRAEIRTVRETVKLYRQAGKPEAPIGLAARAAAQALEAAKPEAEPASEPEPVAAMPEPAVEARPEAAHPVQSLAAITDSLERALLEQRRKISQESLDAEYSRIREDVMGELKQRNWRGWLFHPAWTVAASVIFVCALLIHISPRMNRTEVLYLPANYSRDGGATRQIRERERIPAAEPLQRESVPQAAPEPPPILREAEIMNQDAALPPLPPVPAALPESAQPPRAAAAPTVPPAPLPAPAAAAAPAPAQESWKASPDIRSKRTQGAEILGDAKLETETPPLPRSFSYGGSVATGAAMAEPEEMEMKEEAITLPLSGGGAPSAAMDFAMPSLPELPALIEESERARAAAPLDSEDTAAGEADSAPPIPETTAVGPVIVDMLQMEPPQLIARPTPINVPERIQSLTTLAALQMANNEFEDAWKSIHMLERYDRDAARALAGVLLEMERSALGDPAAEEETPETEERALPAPAEEPEKEAVFAPIESAPIAEPAQPVPAPAPEPMSEPPVSTVPEPEQPVQMVEVLGEPPIDPPLTLVRVPASMLPPVDRSGQWVVEPAPLPELHPATIAAIEPEEVVSEIQATEEAENRVEELAEAEPAFSIVTERMKARPEPEAEMEEVVEAVSEPSPAPAASEPLFVQPATPVYSQQRAPSPRRRPFSTDPYIRGY